MANFDIGNAAQGAIGGASTGGWAGAIAGGLLGGFSGSLTGSSSSGSKRAWALSVVNHALELDAWKRMNDYNSPVNQMKRLREAGLNPALVYGSGNVTGNSSASLAPASLPVFNGSSKKDYSQLGSAVGKFFLSRQMESAQNQNKIEKANEEAIKLDNDYKLGKLELQRLKIERLRQAMGSPSVKPVKPVDPIVEDIKKRRQDKFYESEIKQKFRNSFSIPHLPSWLGSNLLADYLYQRDYDWRVAKSRNSGGRSWSVSSPLSKLGYGL